MTRLLLSFLAVAILVSLPITPDIAQAVTCVQQKNGELTTQLAWTNVDTVTTDTVNILRSTATGAELQWVNIPFAATYTDTVPAPTVKTTYFYTVQAQGPGGKSPQSNEVCKDFFPGPPAPTGLAAQ